MAGAGQNQTWITFEHVTSFEDPIVCPQRYIPMFPRWHLPYPNLVYCQAMWLCRGHVVHVYLLYPQIAVLYVNQIL